MSNRTWTCRRTTDKEICLHANPVRAKKCERCGKLRARKRRPKHLAALAFTYEDYIKMQGGEFCGICGAARPPDRKLDRDHAHDETRKPRGLLCRRCNSALNHQRYGFIITAEWLMKAAAYLERSALREMM